MLSLFIIQQDELMSQFTSSRIHLATLLPCKFCFIVCVCVSVSVYVGVCVCVCVFVCLRL